ncbi:MAG: ATP-dependent RNA helicase HrpA, partial [Deltaproteobacteria bacterium]|nr:ATP-dependent RNA helicase HrpA [Deltaproteobacteria bacterium]
IDEAHERTLNIDFLLGYLRKLLQKRKDLKLIITSATIDVDKFAAAFPQFYHIKQKQNYVDHINPQKQSASTAPAPIIEVSGRMYPVEVRYHPIDEQLEEEGNISIINMVQEAVEDILTETSEGDILVFLSGVQEIREAFEQLQFLVSEGFDVLPLYSRLSGGEQNRIFEIGPKRKIILATNIAETSITIPRIHYVIDSGKARISQYNSRSGTQGLPITRISQSSANQRKGRCGRIANGICIRLYTEEDFISRMEYSTPEIQRSDLSDVIMRMLGLNLGDVKNFPFIDPPESAQIKAGYRTLKELGALDDQKKLSAVGKQIAKLPVDPRTARMIMQAQFEDSLYAVLVIASVISCQDPREWPENKKPQAMQKHARFNSKESDLITFLNLWEHYHNTWEELKTQNKMRKFCKANFLSYIRMREWRDIHNQLGDIAKANHWESKKPDQWDYDGIHKSILAGYLTHIAKKKEKKIYNGTKNRELLLFPGSGQYKNRHEWIVAVEIIETAKLYAHSIAKIDPDWLEPLAGSLCKVSWEIPRWDEKGQNVVANENVSLFGFKIVDSRKVNYGKINIEEATSVFIREALVDRKFRSTLPFWKHNLALIKSIEDKENQTRKRDLLVSDYQIEKFYQDRIKQVSCIQDLQRLINEKGGDKFLFMKETDLLMKKPEAHKNHFPKFMDIIGNKCPLVYKFDPDLDDDGVTLKIPESILNHLRSETFDYLVPGVLQDKIFWLFKNLPKAKRKHLLPISDTAQKVWESMTALSYTSEDSKPKAELKQAFYQELSEELYKLTKVYIEPEEWEISNMPEYLKMNFVVLNSKNKMIKQSRDLSLLQGKSEKKENDWLNLVRPHEQYLITKWDFQDLMEAVTIS